MVSRPFFFLHSSTRPVTLVRRWQIPCHFELLAESEVVDVRNPFSGLLRSRKFWLLILDTIVSALVFFVTKYATPAAAEDAIYMIGLIQPVFVAVIAGIAWEDSAAKRAGVRLE